MMPSDAALLSDDFKKSATAKLEAASSGDFFRSNCARLLPSFDHGPDGGEVALGEELGEGSFCNVKEITAITLKRQPEGGDFGGDGGELPQQSNDQADEADFPVNLFRCESQIRAYMSENYLRRNDDGGDHARYALKRLKPRSAQTQVEDGVLDLAIEAQFLVRLNHPSIIKMRGVLGDPLTLEFGIVLDRLYMTLEDKMDVWVQEKKEASCGGVCGRLLGCINSSIKKELIFSAVTVAYDLACALRYIHSNNLVYRDIKPENAGFDVRGNIKLFDFGLSKELTRSLLDAATGSYKLTKMTGSYPYMAPENFLGKPYGKPVDVFSFGVLFYEMLSGKFAFYRYNRQDYKECVVEKEYRPYLDISLSMRTKEIITESWDPNAEKRPTFDRMCLLLRTEHQELCQEMEENTRSEHMMKASLRSFRTRLHRSQDPNSCQNPNESSLKPSHALEIVGTPNHHT